MLTTSEVSKLIGVSYHRLDRWVRIGLVTPTVAADGSGSRRLWSDGDLVEAVVVAHRIAMCPMKHGGA